MEIVSILIPVTAFIIVIVVHEFAHGYVAYLLGDHTARSSGRLTLNPVAHIDPVGTVILPLVLILTRSPVVFGWAKPVPVNPANFQDPRKGMFMTSLAGPASNILLAVFFSALFNTGIFPPHSVMWTFLLTAVIVSLVLGVFNLIPVPPLDGANILFSLLPKSMYRYFLAIERYGFVILIAMLYLGVFEYVIIPVVNMITRILLS